MANQLKTGLLLAGLTAVLVLIGRWFGGTNGMLIALTFAVVMNVGSYWFSDRIVLAMYRARPLSPDEAPDFQRMVRRLCERAGLPLPALYVIPSPTANAFATGRDPQHAAVAVNEGLLQLLDPAEVEGVVAHELAHVKNRDTLITTIAATIAGAITALAEVARWGALFGGFGRSDDEDRGNPLVLLVMVIVAPLAAMVLQLALSRSREYQADRTGAEICGRPLALASALKKLEWAAEAHPMHAQPATASMFIVNPLRRETFASWFSTHPSTADRVARLEAMAAERDPGLAAYVRR